LDFQGTFQAPSFRGVVLGGTVDASGDVSLSGSFDFTMAPPFPFSSDTIGAHLAVTFRRNGQNVTISGHLTGSFSFSLGIATFSGNLSVDMDLGGSNPSGSGSFTATFKGLDGHVRDVTLGYSVSDHHLSLSNVPPPFSNLLDIAW
jgi:hypothetical protein